MSTFSLARDQEGDWLLLKGAWIIVDNELELLTPADEVKRYRAFTTVRVIPDAAADMLVMWRHHQDVPPHGISVPEESPTIKKWRALCTRTAAKYGKEIPNEDLA